MEVKAFVARIIDKSDALRWKCTCDYNNLPRMEFEFSKYSPAGEDFVFYIGIENGDDVADAVREYANDFDKEDHVKMWIEAKQNGVGGVPSLKELVQDADDIVDMIDELADALEEIEYEED